MNDDPRSAEASPGARLDAALNRRRAAISGEHATTLVGRGEELPRAYPAEILEDAVGGFVASFPDLPEAPSTAGPDASEVRARLPRALLTGLRQIVRDGRRTPPPSAAHGRALVEIPTEALPRLLLHQRMLAAGLDDAEVDWITVSRLKHVSLSGEMVPQQCPVTLEVLLGTFSDSDLEPAALRLLTGEVPHPET